MMESYKFCGSTVRFADGREATKKDLFSCKGSDLIVLNEKQVREIGLVRTLANKPVKASLFREQYAAQKQRWEAEEETNRQYAIAAWERGDD